MACGAVGRPSNLQSALKLAGQGFHVFPLAARSKIPFGDTPGLYMAMRNQTLIRAIWNAMPAANIGIRTGAGLIVIDVDVHGEADGRHYVGEHEDLFPPTVTVNTPTGGRHLYYKLPAGLHLSNSDRALPAGVNIRADGGYVVAPGSTHPDGGMYQWAPGASPAEVDMTPAPSALLLLLAPAPEPKPVAMPTQALAGDNRPSPARLVAWALADIAHAGGRDNAGLRLARQVWANVDDGADGEAIMWMYADQVPTNSSDPYTRADASRNWKSAHNYRRLDPWAMGAPGTDATVQDAGWQPASDIAGLVGDGDPVALLSETLLRLKAMTERAETAEVHNRFVANTLKNPALSNGPKLTLLATYFELTGQIAMGAQPAPATQPGDKPVAGGVPIAMWRLAQNTGQNEKTVRTHLKVLASAGAFERGTVTVFVENAPPQTQVQLAPTSALFSTPHLLKPPEGTPKHSGKRVKAEGPCYVCGSQDVAVETATLHAEYARCMECGTIQDEPAVTGQSDVIAAVRATGQDARWQADDDEQRPDTVFTALAYTDRSADARAVKTRTATGRHAVRGSTAGAPTLRAGADMTRELIGRSP